MKSLAAMAGGLVLMLSGVVGADGEGWVHLGDALAIDEATPIQEITTDPEAYHDHVVRIEGRIASVCTREGCFIELVPTEGGEGIVANFPGLAHTFPTDCAGLEAVVEGRFYQKVYPRARVAHWQQHSFRPGEAIPEYSLAFRMDVRGADIGGTRAAPPPPAAITAASADRIDLERVEFEAEGFGIGRRTVAPGEVVPRPSTGGNRWMIICLEGRLAVHRADRDRPVALETAEMTYVPAGIMFEVRNESSADAALSLVYARRLDEPEAAGHPH